MIRLLSFAFALIAGIGNAVVIGTFSIQGTVTGNTTEFPAFVLAIGQNVPGPTIVSGEAIVGQDGGYTLEALPAGTYLITAKVYAADSNVLLAQGERPHTVTVGPDATGIDIALVIVENPPLSLIGEVVYTGGQVGSVMLTIGNHIATFATVPGTFEFTDFAPGIYPVDAFLDANGDGVWQPGEPAADHPPVEAPTQAAITIFLAETADAYEPDNSPESASMIGGDDPQFHTFHLNPLVRISADAGPDVDYVRLAAGAGVAEFATHDVTGGIQPLLILTASDGSFLTEGIGNISHIFAENTEALLRVLPDLNGALTGSYVLAADFAAPIEHFVIAGHIDFEHMSPQAATITVTTLNGLTFTITAEPNVPFRFDVPAGIYTLTAALADGSMTVSHEPVTVPPSTDNIVILFEADPPIEPDSYEPDNELASAKPIANDVVQNHSIHLDAVGALDTDHVAFYARPGEVWASLETSDGLHLGMSLFDAAGNELPMIVADQVVREEFPFDHPFWIIQTEGDYILRLAPIAGVTAAGHYDLKLTFADLAATAQIGGVVTGVNSARILVFDAFTDGPSIAELNTDANGAFETNVPSPGAYILEAIAHDETLSATVQVPPDAQNLLFAFTPPPVPLQIEVEAIVTEPLIDFYLIFARPVQGLAASDLTVANGSVADLQLLNSGFLVVVAADGPGAVTLTVANGAAVDANGIPSAGGTATTFFLPEQGCDFRPGWEPPVGVQNTMTIHIQIKAHGELIDAPGSMLAAFKGEEIRGVAEVAEGPAGPWFQLSVGSNFAEEQGLTLVVFNADNCETCRSHGSFDFVADSTLGAIDDPLQQNACETTQEIDLVQGWNWLSFNVAPGNPTLDSALSFDPAPSDHMEFKTAPHLGGVATYFGGSWIGMANGIDCGVRYLAHSDGPRTLTVVGEPCEGPIAIVAGWNWIGFSLQEPQPVNVALANFTASDGDELKTAPHLGGTWTYFDGQWFGPNVAMQPGVGYLLRSTVAGELVYNDDPNNGGTITPLPNVSRAAPDWAPPVGLQGTMTVHASVDGVSQAGSKLAAFKDGVVRGVADLINGPGGAQFILSLGSDAAVEPGLTFAVYDAGTDSICDITQTVDFAVDTTVGLINDPIELSCQAVEPPTISYSPHPAIVEEEGVLTITVTATGDDLTWTHTQPSNGSFQPQILRIAIFEPGVQHYAYAPNANYHGSDSFAVTVSNEGGSATLEIPITIEAVNDAPANTEAPSIGGDLEAGATLTANPGTWNDSADLAPGNISFAYQWQTFSDGEDDIADATSDNFVVTENLAGRRVRVVVTATDDGEAGTSASGVASSAWGDIAEIVVEPLDVTQTPAADASISLMEGRDSQVFSVGAAARGEIVWSVDGNSVGQGPSFTYAPDHSAVAHPDRSRPVAISASIDGASVSWSAVSVRDVDRLPLLPAIAIAPAAPSTEDRLVVQILDQSADPDGDAISGYAVNWALLGNAREAFSGMELSASETQKHNVWEAHVRPITNPYGEVDTATVEASSASILIENSVPEAAIMDIVLTGMGASADITLDGSDADLQDVLSFIIDSQPNHGSLILIGETVTYTPDSNFIGEDSFSYAVSDSEAQSASVVVDIHVQGWLLPIAVTESQLEGLLIGMHGQATNGFDVGIDDVSPPAGQDTATVGLEGDPLLSADLRAIGDEADWILSVDASSAIEEVVISWNTTAVPELGLFLEELEGDMSIDMRAVNQITVTPGQVRNFSIHYGVIEFSIHLRKGWNIISVPVRPLNTDVQAALGETGGVWEWLSYAANPSREGDPTGEFIPAQEIVPRKGYFVLSNEARDVTIRGSIVSETTTLLQRHWTLFGVTSTPPFLPRHPGEALDSGELEIRSHIWRWNGRRYRRSLRLKAGVGHWVYSDVPILIQPFREAAPGE